MSLLVRLQENIHAIELLLQILIANEAIAFVLLAAQALRCTRLPQTN